MKYKMWIYSLAVILAGPTLRAADGAGSLRGTVTDPTGAVVPGATVVVSNEKWAEGLVSNEKGRYVVTDLVPGTYEVSVSSEGFAPFDRKGLVIVAGKRSELDAPLDVAPVIQEITVPAGGRRHRVTPSSPDPK
jgi:hypothetical protein